MTTLKMPELFGLETKIYNCSGIILFNNDFTKIILVKTHMNHYSFPKGNREKNENIYETAVRETEEETGLTPDKYVLSDYLIGEFKTSKSVSTLYFIGKLCQTVSNTKFTYDNNELADVSWISIDQAFAMDDTIFLESRRLVLKKALQEVKKTDFKFYSSSHISKLDKLKKHSELKLNDISKICSSILRHNIVKFGLDVDQEGYVLIDQLLKIKNLNGVTVDMLKKVVENNKKNRFTIITRNDNMYIRANQGHSTTVGLLLNDKKMMKQISLNDGIDKGYHGTSINNWKSIQNEGLNRMDRKHCHLSRITKDDKKDDKKNDKTHICGIRTNSEIILEIDIKQGLKDGIEFFLSDNDVILTVGPIPPSLIKVNKK